MARFLILKLSGERALNADMVRVCMCERQWYVLTPGHALTTIAWLGAGEQHNLIAVHTHGQNRQRVEYQRNGVFVYGFGKIVVVMNY